ncbi:MAG: hypothetical protein WBI55_05445 [Eubacteriales bacterium]|jgi:stage III sporulation protein AG|nr:hypothetical protein [Clostridiales bacterium]
MEEGKLTGVWRAVKSKKLIVFLVAAGILLLAADLIFIRGSSDKNKGNISATVYTAYTEELERRVRDICDKVAGVSNVSVLLTLESSNEYVYAENSSGASVYDYLVINGKDGEEPVLIKEIYASVRGIAIVCDGGDSAKIKATLTELLSSAFNLPTNKISIAGTGR